MNPKEDTTAKTPVFKDRQGNSYEIPLEGNLSLLAYGDIGLLAWREKKLAFFKANQQQQNALKDE